VGRSSRILHHHDRLTRSPNLSRSGSNRAFRPLRKSGNAGIRGIDGKRQPIRESESQSISLRGLRRLTSWFSFFRVFRGTSLPLRADSGPGDSEQDGKAERTWRGVAEPRRSQQGVFPGAFEYDLVASGGAIRRTRTCAATEIGMESPELTQRCVWCPQNWLDTLWRYAAAIGRRLVLTTEAIRDTRPAQSKAKRVRAARER